ncbi:Uncharacterised protein [Burkholderia pseudomallei]|nr:Uncharacterised protein [Burkholderia pseudomallei]CAJ3843974.1 Uncharacterised protein [Burkholderia pseudomallei]CAJ5088704.1 Uncharacterised protein [Burkholderia pseudomallei]CAJ5641479.1 Uncharacterised protein [Burkholderia pseudomallei]CAJ8433676.1 Uncharacterised protein [Burkholderia pseudomallei]
MRRAPLPAYRSLSAVPFACRFRLPLLTPGPLPLAPSPFYSLPFTFTLRPRPVSRFQPSAGSPPFGQRRAPARARRPGATTARAGHDAHRPSAFGALTNPCKTCPLRMPRDHACKHGGICHAMQPNRACPQSIVPSTDTRRPPGATIACPTRSPHARLCTRRHAVAQETHQKGSPMHESKSFDAGLARRGTTATTRPARQASAAASTRRRHAARAPPPKASRLPTTARHDVAGMRVAHRPPPAAQSDANTRAAFSTATRMRTGTDESKRASSVRASVRECRRHARRTGPRPRQSAGVGRSCASLAASSPSPSLSSSASRRAGSPLVSRSVRARSASSR